MDIPAAVRFLSVEPMLEPIDLQYAAFNGADSFGTMEGIHWVIVGGESGHHARPFDPLWAKSIVEQCRRAGVPVFVKQLGSKPVLGDIGDLHGWPAGPGPVDWETGRIHLRHSHGADPAEWPAELRVREFPELGAAP